MDFTDRQKLEDASTLQFLGGIKEDFEKEHPNETEAQILQRFKTYMVELLELRFTQICDLRPHLTTPNMIDRTISPDTFPNSLGIALQRGEFYMCTMSIQIIWEQLTCLIRVKPTSYPPMHLKLKDWEGKIYTAYRHAIGVLTFGSEAVNCNLLFRFLHRDVPAIREEFRHFKEAWLVEDPAVETQVNDQVQVQEGESA
ncbi:hypothetical protein DL98DRAFT_594266 [Cadophora sp. DSE1049]|nr:hypothetical protein DL98DRAFT_594266 [Cadophora sp. DSE1049]